MPDVSPFQGAGPNSTPRTLALVVSVYGVEPYLPAFLKSLDGQGPVLDEVQLIFVDDGSPDRSHEIIVDWASCRPQPVTIIRQENRGLSASRNAGLTQVDAQWVSFPDPDDVLGRDYIASMLDYLRSPASTSVSVVGSNIIYLNDEDGRRQNDHPLRFKFNTAAPHSRGLLTAPHYLHLQAASGFYRVARIREKGLAFDPEIVPVAEDIAFTSYYLMSDPEPEVGVVPAAVYLYRRRADSLVGSSWAKEERYLTVTRKVHLALLTHAHDVLGFVPAWLQNVVMYDLQWYFKNDQHIKSPTAAISAEVSSAFYGLLAQIMTFIDDETVLTYRLTWIPTEIRLALLAVKGSRLPEQNVRIVEMDGVRGLLKGVYYFAGARPSEIIHSAGVQVTPVFSKDRAIRFLGKTLLFQRIIWLPSSEWVEIWLDGRRSTTEFDEQRMTRYTVTDYQARKHFGVKVGGPARIDAPRPRPSIRGAVRGVRKWGRRLRVWARASGDDMTVRLARSGWARRRFGNAWTLIDRDSQARDNAEEFYRYLSSSHPEIVSWFVLNRNSFDWARLKADGFRLVAYGSLLHRLLILNTAHLISSQIDWYIVRPLDPRRFGRQRWRFTFLQHGVTKDDLSLWINSKPIARLITATEPETESIAADGTPYVFTRKETIRTGFPRHDRLLRTAQEIPVDKRDLIVLMPTWRSWLMDEGRRVGNARLLRDEFWDSRFAAEWFGLLNDERLHDLARVHGLGIGFMPHPNLSGHIPPERLPSGVSLLTYADDDFAGVIARARVVVTDYSSNAFEAAIAERPLLYFQFDREEFFAGSHAYRKGYFDYDEDGFGPVAQTIDAGIAALGEILEWESIPDPFATRIAASFIRDQNASERVYRSIWALDHPDLPVSDAAEPALADATAMPDTATSELTLP